MSCCKGSNNSCGKKNATQDTSVDYLVCTCMGVMYQEILEAIRSGKDTFEALSESLGVGTGCSSCVAEVQEMLKQNTCSGPDKC